MGKRPLASCGRMAYLLAECPVHGVVPSFINVHPGAMNFSVHGPLGISCTVPGCDQVATVLDGQFSVGLDDIVRVMAAPAYTIARLKQLRGALQWARVHLPQDPEEALQRVEKVDPFIGKFVRQWWGQASDTNRIAVGAVAVTAAGVALQAGISLLTALITLSGVFMEERRAVRGDISEERSRRIAEEVFEGHQDPLPPLAPPPALPPATPPPALPPPPAPAPEPPTG